MSFSLGIALQSQDFMGIITLDLGLYGATVVLFHIISVVHLWLGGPRPERVGGAGGRAKTRAAGLRPG